MNKETIVATHENVYKFGDLDLKQFNRNAVLVPMEKKVIKQV